MKKQICALFFIAFLSITLFAQELDWKAIIENEYEGYFSDHIVSKVKNPSPTSFELFSPDKFTTVLKQRKNVKRAGNLYRYENDDNFIKMTSIDFSASSQNSNSYKAANVFDANLSTAWVEGKADFGRGEWVEISLVADFKRKTAFSKAVGSIFIFPGYGKSEKLFYENNRIKSALLIASTKTSIQDNHDKQVLIWRLEFKDEPKYHVFDIENAAINGEDQRYRLYIEDVYKGSKYNDTCISEIGFL